MVNGVKLFLSLGLVLGAAACQSDKHESYSRQRPDVDSLDERDSGLQSKDVVAASEQMARDILADPSVRQSPVQWTVVVDRFEDRTIDRAWNVNYDIFIERLRTSLGRYGKGQVQLLENKAKLAQLRSKELDGADPAGAARMQANYALYGRAMDLPNRGTNYYLLEFTITDLKTGAQVWTNHYEVKVAR